MRLHTGFLAIAPASTNTIGEKMSTATSQVNAWIFLNEDEPPNTNYNSPNSCYQTLIQNNVYQSVDMLFICFVSTTPTGNDTYPVGNGDSYTLEMAAVPHPGGLTNQDYMKFVIRDARANNPNIKFGVTLNWGDGNLLSNIFSNTNYSDQQNADNFAANLMAYLEYYELDGFDIDWEYPISNQTTQSQFSLLINAIGQQFKNNASQKHYYLTLSPAEVGNLDSNAVNANVDFINLQLYSGFTTPAEFQNAGVNSNLFAYGAKFESGFQTASAAFQDNKANYGYSIFTNWRLNSDNYQFEQAQQQQLYQLVFPPAATKS